MLSYDDLGRGQTIILLHGFCESKALWKDFEEELSDKYRVLNIDLPGFGESQLNESNITIEWYASQINELLQELGIDKVVIIGHSLGGYVGLAFAKLYEKKLLGLGLIHSNAFADTEERVNVRNKVLVFLEKQGIKRFISSFVPPLFYIKTRKQIEDKVKAVIEMGQNTSLHTAIEVTKAMRDRPSYVKTLTSIKIPVLYVIGKEDTSVPFEVSEQQMNLPQNSIIHILEEVGHMGMLEKPDLIRKAIDNFLEKI